MKTKRGLVILIVFVLVLVLALSVFAPVNGHGTKVTVERPTKRPCDVFFTPYPGQENVSVRCIGTVVGIPNKVTVDPIP